MDKQPSYHQFSELTNTELNQVVGGDWWADLFTMFTNHYSSKKAKPKLM